MVWMWILMNARLPSREFLRLSIWGASILHFCNTAVTPGDVRVARRDVVFLPAGQERLPLRATAGTALGISGVVHHNHGGIHPRQRVHAALPRRVHPRRAKFQLVIAGHFDERAPTERTLEAGAKPGDISEWSERWSWHTNCRRWHVAVILITQQYSTVNSILAVNVSWIDWGSIRWYSSLRKSNIFFFLKSNPFIWPRCHRLTIKTMIDRQMAPNYIRWCIEQIRWSLTFHNNAKRGTFSSGFK